SLLEELKSKLQSRVITIRQLNERLEQDSIPILEEELKCRLENLNASINKANQIQEPIEEIDSGDEYGDELEELSIVTKAKLMSLLSAIRLAASSETPGSAAVAPTRARLPSLALPKFSGNYSELKNFISLFETLVHKDASFSVI
ncbi:hypothetical protein KR038_010106, partial [Drosophila bunnanda]